MIRDLFLFLQNAVNDYLNVSSGLDLPQPGQDSVVFLESQTADSLDFKLGSITLLLVNLEEDHTVRAADPNRRTLPDGTTLKVQPPIHMVAYALFVARYKDYQQSLRYISLIARFFQNHRVFDQANAPLLSGKIDKVTAELLTLSLSEQNDLWSFLRACYQPSLLYKIRMVIFQDDETVAGPPILEPIVRING